MKLRRPDTRHWLDKGRYCYPLSIAVCLAAYYLLVGCSAMPPKEINVIWNTPCTKGPDMKRIKFVDTNTPLLACIGAAPPGDATRLTIMAILGFPIAGCALVDANRDYAEIYAILTPSVYQSLAGITTVVGSGEDYVQHEVEHVFGHGHPSLLWFLDSCNE